MRRGYLKRIFNRKEREAGAKIHKFKSLIIISSRPLCNPDNYRDLATFAVN